jgi:hypothetical protein
MPTDDQLTELAPLVQAMIEDGVDVSDEAAVREWLSGEADPFADDELDVSMKEAYGLPDRLPPLRLPSDAELAAVARNCPPLERARRFAEWADGRPVSDDDALTAADCVAAAELLGLEVPETVESIRDVPALAQVWELVESVEFIEVGAETVSLGEAMSAWPDGSDEDVLDVWATALAVTMSSLDVDLDLVDDEENEAEFFGIGGPILMSLFLARGEGLTHDELSELAGEIPESWLATHGDPVLVLLDRLGELGAATYDGEQARLTPLAQWALWVQLEESEVEVPLLPAVEDMTAADLVAAVEGFTEEEMAAEEAAWLARHTPEHAAAELLEHAAEGGPADRLYTTTLATRLGEPVEPLWRKAFDDPRLRPYARLALNQTLDPDDLAWLLTDVLAAFSAVEGPEDIAEQLSDVVPPGREEEIFEAMWRLPHPDAGEVLTMIGSHHPDKQIAKAARKAAFKAASHQP